MPKLSTAQKAELETVAIAESVKSEESVESVLGVNQPVDAYPAEPAPKRRSGRSRAQKNADAVMAAATEADAPKAEESDPTAEPDAGGDAASGDAASGDASSGEGFDNLTGADYGQFDQEYAVVDVDTIQPHPKNPNKGDVELIQQSIEANTWYGACTVQRSTGYILAGEHRWRAAKQLGVLQIPVIYKNVDDRAAIRIMLIDNESARAAHQDEVAIRELLDELAPITDDSGTRVEVELVGSGFSLAFLEDTEREAQELAAAQATEAETRAAARAVGNAAGGVNPGDVPDDSDRAVQYGVLIIADNEAHQEMVYNWLRKEDGDLTIRVVAV